jgi:hypothetical protein
MLEVAKNFSFYEKEMMNESKRRMENSSEEKKYSQIYDEFLRNIYDTSYDIHQTDKEGNTILHYLIKNEIWHFVVLLLKKETDINLANQNGETVKKLLENYPKYFLHELNIRNLVPGKRYFREFPPNIQQLIFDLLLPKENVSFKELKTIMINTDINTKRNKWLYIQRSTKISLMEKMMWLLEYKEGRNSFILNIMQQNVNYKTVKEFNRLVKFWNHLEYNIKDYEEFFEQLGQKGIGTNKQWISTKQASWYRSYLFQSFLKKMIALGMKENYNFQKHTIFQNSIFLKILIEERNNYITNDLNININQKNNFNRRKI